MGNYDNRFAAANMRRKTDKHAKDVRSDILKQIDDAETLDEMKAATKRLVHALRILTQ